MALLTNYFLFITDFSEIKSCLLNNMAASATISFFKSHMMELILLAVVIFVKDILPELKLKREHHRQ